MDGSGRDCRMLNLNSRGAFVESFVPPVTGTQVILHFRLPSGHQIRAFGVVSNHQLKVGFDLDFTDLSAFDREQINNFLS